MWQICWVHAGLSDGVKSIHFIVIFTGHAEVCWLGHPAQTETQSIAATVRRTEAA